MTKTKVLTILTLSGMVTAVACDGASSGTAGDLSTSDCALGMFRPTGLADCVFPADDQSGNPLGVSDNRCVEGQPAVPPRCTSYSGGRAYLAATMTCAPDYHYEPGACDRGGGVGGVETGTAGAFDGPDTGAAGAFEGTAGTTTTTGFAAGTGGAMTGVGTGEGGSTFPGDDAAGASGGFAGSGGATAIDGSADDAMSSD